MHEISLMQAALTVALDHAQAQGAQHIHRLQLQVGDLSGVDPEALAFAFDVVTRGTLAEKAELELIPVPVVCYCSSCQQMFQPLDWVYECPCCHQLSTDIRQGRTLELASLEIS
ncbi:hydrogenase maturation nickel metallochaperone HypA [Leptolyngbya cf. ectocarpi LEGE 11479]|uniref:Hydrogenase maturation factor HypA n=1 Tax=Leptolyngbya cf. ectocarpi LEGE 11479 TaxID=1828722 RepID=A0A928ZYL3_LEPEC|nr:hydrogenase maturation nickel metallochaperone HypA [Leptolyngbya ectocarpi]MBE9069837.1 hydrogenase maturation nickel metallochaperone HypA [Leptolyngbya cf. ectocarpi LEGE 11479]